MHHSALFHHPRLRAAAAVSLAIILLVLGRPAEASTCYTLAHAVLDSGVCQCELGYYQSSNSCIACNADTYKNALGNSSSLCVSCPFGMYTNSAVGQNSCTPRPGFVDMGFGVYACPASKGYYNYTCDFCGVDTYSSTPVTTPCFPCPTNTSTFGFTGMTSCWSTTAYILSADGLLCASGAGMSNGVCATCAVNYYKDHTGNDSCSACPTGSGTANQTGANMAELCVKDSSAAQPSTTPSSSASTGAVIGGVMGSIALVALGVSAYVVVAHRRKKQHEDDAAAIEAASAQAGDGLPNVANGLCSSCGNSANSSFRSSDHPSQGHHHHNHQSPSDHIAALQPLYTTSGHSSNSQGHQPGSNHAAQSSLNGRLYVGDANQTIRSRDLSGHGGASRGSSNSHHSTPLPLLGLVVGNSGQGMHNAFGTNGQQTMQMVRTLINHPRFLATPAGIMAAASAQQLSNRSGGTSQYPETISSQHSANASPGATSNVRFHTTHAAGMTPPEVPPVPSALPANGTATQNISLYQTAKLSQTQARFAIPPMPLTGANAQPPLPSGAQQNTLLSVANRHHSVNGHGANSVAGPGTRTAIVPHQMVLAYPAFLQINSDTGMRTIERFAEGGFALLYRGELLDRSVIPAEYAGLAKNVAIKVFKQRDKRLAGLQRGLNGSGTHNGSETAPDANADLENEASIMYALNFSPNIVKLLAVSKQPQLTLVMQMYDESLASLLHNPVSPHRDMALSAADNSPIRLVANFTHDIVAGLQSIHSLGVAHLDIKPSNMLVEHVTNIHENRTKFRYRVVICDFGLARVLNEGSSLRAPQRKLSNGISIHYAAPEAFAIIRVLESGGNVSPLAFYKLDMFSLGSTVNELMTREVPFRERSPLEIEPLLLRGERPSTAAIPQPDNEQETLRLLYLLEIIRLCWCASPEDRADASYLLELASEMVKIVPMG